MTKCIRMNMIVVSLFVANVVAAQGTGPTTQGTAVDPVEAYNPLSARSVPEVIKNATTAILGVVGALALAMFIYGGLMWMTSLGNQQRVEKGKETLKWATIGLIVIFASYSLLSFIFKAFTGAA